MTPPVSPPSARRLLAKLFTVLRTPSSFAVVGLLGLVVNQAVLIYATDDLGVYYLASALLATLFSTTFNFTLIEIFVFARRHPGATYQRYFAFLALNVSSGLLLRIPVLFVATDLGGLNYAYSNVIALGFTFLFRYLVADRWIWAGRSREAVAPGADGAYVYDLHGLLHIRSEIALPELFAFATTAPLDAPVDLLVHRRSLLGGHPRLRSSLARGRDGVLRYRELPGAAGAAFNLLDDVEPGEPVVLEANWLLARSDHVLYTNMVEPLIRFLLAARGHLLLHGASLAGPAGGLILSARTDTGKTGTVLRLLAAGWGDFLGDDMVIIDPDGKMFGYPKPLTISSHTMRAVPKGADLSLPDRIMLALRSRLHSRGGRSFGQSLARLPIPIVTINAWVQILVPPPKYAVTTLVPTTVTETAALHTVAVIERGPQLTYEPGVEELLDTLLANTEDAYGFPPFADLSTALHVGSRGVDSLRDAERAILASAIGGARRLLVRTDDWSWPERLSAAVAS